MVYTIDTGMRIGKFNNFKYNLSSEQYTFPVDPLTIKQDWVKVASVVKERSIDIELIIKISLLQQLQLQGMLDMDIVRLVSEGRSEEIDKVSTACIGQVEKWGLRYVKKLDPKTNRYLRVWDFGKEQEE